MRFGLVYNLPIGASMEQLIPRLILCLAYVFIAIPLIGRIADGHVLREYTYSECFGAGVVVHAMFALSILIGSILWWSIKSVLT